MANYPLPPTLQGNQVQQLADVRRYLFRLVEQLNTSAEQLGSAQTGGNGSAAMSAAGGTAGGKTELNAAQEELKTLIIKTANTVRHELDALTARLNGSPVRLVQDLREAEAVLRTQAPAFGAVVVAGARDPGLPALARRLAGKEEEE